MHVVLSPFGRKAVKNEGGREGSQISVALHSEEGNIKMNKQNLDKDCVTLQGCKSKKSG